jgi:cysteinyl-tRNA synthetase
MLKVTNTLGWKREEFKSIKPNEVLFYQCGPTVYWNQHIGNMRGMTMADLINRSLKYLGYNVKFVRNYTDFGHLTGDNIGDADTGEDRMEKAAKRENLDPKTIADKYIMQFEKDLAALNIIEPTIKARATDYIEKMIEIVKTLLEKGFAYSTPKAIYFDTSKFPNYYDLSGNIAEDHIVGAGHGTVGDSNKKNNADFALWFFKTGDHKNALQSWPSPFTSPEVENGEGFPGWHIECSAMASATLGHTIDIHMGGIEHISIHHTNEIAQSESAFGQKFANYWLHNEHLMQNGKKIAKSDGNFFLLDDLIKLGYNPMHLRYLFLQAHYRSKQNFTIEALDASRIAYEKLLNLYNKLQDKTDNIKGNIVQKFENKFIEALEDDFNTPAALAVLWELVKSEEKPSDIIATINKFDNVLGIQIEMNSKALLSKQKTIEGKASIVRPQDTVEVGKLVKEREEARVNKDWKKADEIRDKLKNEYGYEVKDQATK